MGPPTTALCKTTDGVLETDQATPRSDLHFYLQLIILIPGNCQQMLHQAGQTTYLQVCTALLRFPKDVYKEHPFRLLYCFVTIGHSTVIALIYLSCQLAKALATCQSNHHLVLTENSELLKYHPPSSVSRPFPIPPISFSRLSIPS